MCKDIVLRYCVIYTYVYTYTIYHHIHHTSHHINIPHTYTYPYDMIYTGYGRTPGYDDEDDDEHESEPEHEHEHEHANEYKHKPIRSLFSINDDNVNGNINGKSTSMTSTQHSSSPVKSTSPAIKNEQKGEMIAQYVDSVIEKINGKEQHFKDASVTALFKVCLHLC